jgi:hypothetical protein
MQCVPITKLWNILQAGGTCFVESGNNFGSPILNIVTDALILLLPIPFVFQMSAKWTEKSLIFGSFLIGAS